jgi:hypothetical protein
MLLGNPRFYIGLIDGAPAHLGFTGHSITVELFRSAEDAKAHFGSMDIGYVRVKPVIKLLESSPKEPDIEKQIAKELLILANYIIPDEFPTKAWQVPLPEVVARICADKEQTITAISLIAVRLAEYAAKLGELNG